MASASRERLVLYIYAGLLCWRLREEWTIVDALVFVLFFMFLPYGAQLAYDYKRTRQTMVLASAVLGVWIVCQLGASVWAHVLYLSSTPVFLLHQLYFYTRSEYFYTIYNERIRGTYLLSLFYAWASLFWAYFSTYLAADSLVHLIFFYWAPYVGALWYGYFQTRSWHIPLAHGTTPLPYLCECIETQAALLPESKSTYLDGDLFVLKNHVIFVLSNEIAILRKDTASHRLILEHTIYTNGGAITVHSEGESSVDLIYAETATTLQRVTIPLSTAPVSWNDQGTDITMFLLRAYYTAVASQGALICKLYSAPWHDQSTERVVISFHTSAYQESVSPSVVLHFGTTHLVIPFDYTKRRDDIPWNSDQMSKQANHQVASLLRMYTGLVRCTRDGRMIWFLMVRELFDCTEFVYGNVDVDKQRPVWYHHAMRVHTDDKKKEKLFSYDMYVPTNGADPLLVVVHTGRHQVLYYRMSEHGLSDKGGIQPQLAMKPSPLDFISSVRFCRHLDHFWIAEDKIITVGFSPRMVFLYEYDLQSDTWALIAQRQLRGELFWDYREQEKYGDQLGAQFIVRSIPERNGIEITMAYMGNVVCMNMLC
jgi:hypothetical protein